METTENVALYHEVSKSRLPIDKQNNIQNKRGKKQVENMQSEMNRLVET